MLTNGSSLVSDRDCRACHEVCQLRHSIEQQHLGTWAHTNGIYCWSEPNHKETKSFFVEYGHVWASRSEPLTIAPAEEQDYPVRFNWRHLLEPDYELEHYCRLMVAVEGESIEKNTIQV